MRIREWFWSLLPDTCEVQGCCRKGMRGNEVINFPWPDQYKELGITMCDYCNSKYMHGEVLYVHGSMPMIARGNGVVSGMDQYLRRKKHEDEE